MSAASRGRRGHSRSHSCSPPPAPSSRWSSRAAAHSSPLPPAASGSPSRCSFCCENLRRMNADRRSEAVLITGCSSGIGHATAEHLAKQGHTVYATARRPDSIQDLEEHGCRLLALDVTDEASMAAAVKAVEEAEGAVGVLVNNAGYRQSGAVEPVPMDAVRRQFDSNVFGLVRMCQLALPGMRAQHWGRIINISSMGANLVFPGGGAYHATKFSVNALSDALRFEVKGFGVDVTVIEPGLITTEFGSTASADVGGGDGPYAEFNAAVAKATDDVYKKGPARHL